MRLIAPCKVTQCDLCDTILLCYCNEFKAIIHESVDLKEVVCD